MQPQKFIPVHKKLFGKYVRYANVVVRTDGETALYGHGLHLGESHIATKDRHDNTPTNEWAAKLIGEPGKPLANDGFLDFEVSYSDWFKSWHILGYFTSEALSLDVSSATCTAISGGYADKQQADTDAARCSRYGVIACYKAWADGNLEELAV